MPPTYICNVYIIFQTKQRGNIGKKTLLENLPEAFQYENIENTEGQNPEIAILFNCNRFFMKQEQAVLNKYKVWSFEELVKKQPPAAGFFIGGSSCFFFAWVAVASLSYGG